MSFYKGSLFKRWLEKVEFTENCWLWKGALKDTGYGVIQRGRRGQGQIRAHVFAYEYFQGPIPEGHEIRHLCNRRDCVNPSHLTTGTRADNMADMVKAGRWDAFGRRRIHLRPRDKKGRFVRVAEP